MLIEPLIRSSFMSNLHFEGSGEFEVKKIDVISQNVREEVKHEEYIHNLFVTKIVAVAT